MVELHFVSLQEAIVATKQSPFESAETTPHNLILKSEIATLRFDRLRVARNDILNFYKDVPRIKKVPEVE